MSKVFWGLNNRMPGATRMGLPFSWASAVDVKVSVPRFAASGNGRLMPRPGSTWAAAGKAADNTPHASAANAKWRKRPLGLLSGVKERQRFMVYIQGLNSRF